MANLIIAQLESGKLYPGNTTLPVFGGGGQQFASSVQQYDPEKAKDLLRLSDLNIAQVADAVGFQDPSYFGRVFAEEFGLSPSQFREVAEK